MGTRISINRQKKEFINTIALRSAINAAVQTRSNIYPVFSDAVTPSRADSAAVKRQKWERKTKLLSFWRNELVSIAAKYTTPKTEKEFIDDVLCLKKSLTKEDGGVFHNGKARIAQCQKSLSVYLKWLWCLGVIKSAPPVCPVDRNVINKCYYSLDRKTEHTERQFLRCVNSDGGWSIIDDIDVYKWILEIISKVAARDGKGMAEWELSFFNDILDLEEE